MNKTLMILVASTALTASVAVPAWSSITNRVDGASSAAIESDTQSQHMMFASNDDDDDGYRRRYGADHDGDDDHGRGHDDDDDYGGGANNAAPAGTVAPPENGLFQGGVRPIVRTN